jgi:predicted Zn-dependent peptidase
MKKSLMALSSLLMLGSVGTQAQKVAFEEYKLSNGLHVILHEDKSAPVVKVEVMYHVGSKDDPYQRTGFAHFFEHLLFEGTQNIERGEWFKIVSSNGGQNNAGTSYDYTTYYEVFPANSLQLGLWMESERMLHPVINQVGVDTQNGVIKEEKRQVQDNRPYGNLISQVTDKLFPGHGYQHPVIGSMEDLDNAKLEEFIAFHNKFYKPNNAVLVVAGDFDPVQTKKWIKEYFEPIPAGPSVTRKAIKLEPINEQINAVFEDANIQLPMMIAAYRTPDMGSRDAKVLSMISTILSDGKSSRMYKKIVEDKKMALQMGAASLSLKDFGMYVVYGLPMGDVTLSDLLKEADEEIVKLQNELISDREFEKLQNIYENQFVNMNSSAEGIASTLASNHLLLGDANLINTELDIYRSITREEIRDIARKYLNPNQRLVLDYIPTQDNAKN